MANKILHKRNLTGSILPTTSSLDIGELAINVADGKVHLRKSGSNEDVIVSLVTANTVTTGSIHITNGITGSLFGTASYYQETDPIFTSLSASYATTSSFNQFTSSYIQDSSSFDTRISNNSSSISSLSNSFISISSSYINLSGSFRTGSYTGSFIGDLIGTASVSQISESSSYSETASYAFNAISSSYAISASFLIGGVPSSNPFPFTGSAIISGSLEVTGSVSATNFTGSLFGTSSWAENAISTFRSGYIGRDVYYVPVTVDNEVTNGNNLLEAYTWAKANALPSGSALSIVNRFTIFLPPGRYNVTSSLTLDTDFIDICGMSGDPEAVIITSGTVNVITLSNTINSYKLRNLTIENDANSTSIYCINIPNTANTRRDEEWDNIKFQYGKNAGVNTRIHINGRKFQGKYNNISLESLVIGTGTTYPTQHIVMNLFGILNRTAGETPTGECSGIFSNINIVPKWRQDTGSFQNISYELFGSATLSGIFQNVSVSTYTPNNASNSVSNLGRVQIAANCTTVSGRFSNFSFSNPSGTTSNTLSLFAFSGGNCTYSGGFTNMKFLCRNNSTIIFGGSVSTTGDILSGFFENISLDLISNSSTGPCFFNGSTLSGTFINCTAKMGLFEGAFGGGKQAAQSILSGTFINCGVIVTGNNSGGANNKGIFGGNRGNGNAQRGVCSGYFKRCYHRVLGTGATIATFAGSVNGEASGYFEDCEISCASTITEFRPFGGITLNGFSGTMHNCFLQSTWPALISGQMYRCDFLASAATASAITNLLTGSKLAYCRAISTGGSASMQGTTSSYYLCSFNVAPTNPNLITTPYNVIDVNI